MADNENNCPTCADNAHAMGKALTGTTDSVFVREYTPPTQAELELTRRVYGEMARIRRPFNRDEFSVPVGPRPEADGANELRIAETTSPKGLPVMVDRSRPTHAPENTGAATSGSQRVSWGEEFLLTSQLTAPWFEPKHLGTMLLQANGGCEETIFVDKEPDLPEPSKEEVDAVLKAVAKHLAEILKGSMSYLRVELPNGEVRWYKVDPAITLACQGVVIAKLVKRGPMVKPQDWARSGVVVIELDLSNGATGNGAEQPTEPSPAYTCPTAQPSETMAGNTYSPARKRDFTYTPPAGEPPKWDETWSEYLNKLVSLAQPGDTNTLRRWKQHYNEFQKKCADEGGVAFFQVFDHMGQPMESSKSPEVHGNSVRLVCYKCVGTCPENKTCIPIEQSATILCDCI
ncbi:MAG: hypothetical protein KF696_02135 [Planctomycetes bacterium]|nr:hypothetical protein [Planctomycetota bacterium]MCW8134800.1 hypothetical protein [Planctomycetota bacterium]